MSFETNLQAELKRLFTNVENQNVLCILNHVENSSILIEALSKAKEVYVFTESSDTYKQLDEQAKKCSVKLNLNCAEFNNAKLKEDLFDTVILMNVLNQLNKDDAQKTLTNVLSVLKQHGEMFAYESQWKTADGKTINPVDLIHNLTSIKVGQEKKFGFEFFFARPLRSFVEFKNDSFQICFSFKKIDKTDDPKTLQDFLDQQQYSRNGVLRYERIFGAGFVSTGGIDTTSEFLERLNLKKGDLVLDVGCGIGGGNILMAEKYGSSVIGVDLSTNMVGIAYERLFDMKDKNLKVSFEIGDIMEHEFEPNSFDLIYSRDTILHIPDKTALFARLYKMLKPGGQIFVTDYTCAPKEEWSKDYQEYVAQRRYILLTVPEYGKVLENVGFTNVKAEDVTDKFVESLNKELARIESVKEDFIKEFSEEDYQHLVEGWHSKLQRSAKGDQRWGLFHAKK